ncbi:MAG: hypothetical protein MJ182_07475 [Treponema sp.]|nr:hypothetical protein [Treponema sp.]
MKHKVLFLFFNLLVFSSIFSSYGFSSELRPQDLKTDGDLDTPSQTLLSTPKDQQRLHGTDLSRFTLNELKKNGFSPEINPIVLSTHNDVPFNISVIFPSSNKGISSGYRDNLIFIIPQDEYRKETDFFAEVLSKLSAENRNFDITFLFSFNTPQEIPGFYPISGETAYLSSIEDKQSCSAIFLKLESDKTKIIPGAGKQISPTWFIKNAYSAITKNKILNFFQSCYISFFYKLNLYEENTLEEFLTQGIPAISIELTKKLDKETKENFIFDLCKNYDIKDTISNDTHSFMFTLFNHNIWIREGLITRLIIIVIFFTFLILVMYGFLNKNLGLKAWNRIRKIWFYPIGIYFTSIIVFHCYKSLVSSLLKIGINIPISSSISFILPLNFSILCLYFFTVLKFRPNFTKRTIDFLTLITASINLILFSLFDISLFPLLATEFILAWISTVFPQNFVHFSIMILFEIPYLPFILQLLSNSEPSKMENLLRNNNYLSLILYLLLLPQYMNCFRVFTGLNFYWLKKNRKGIRKETNNIITYAFMLVAFEVALFFLIPDSFKSSSKNKNQILLKNSKDDFISAKVLESKVFTDTVRTIEITSEKDLEYCDVRIYSKSSSPLLYSDDEYFTPSSTTAVFNLTYQPPKELSFSYGAQQNDSSEVIISAIYCENGEYFQTEKRIRTGIK